MKKNTFLFIIVIILSGCVTGEYYSSGIRPKDVAEKPSVFCNVIDKPDPVLMGGWQCQYRTDRISNPVEFWLVQHGDQYALYYFFTQYNGRDRNTGWRNWTINGKEIYSPNKDIRFFVKNENVYFSWKGETPIKMDQIPNK